MAIEDGNGAAAPGARTLVRGLALLELVAAAPDGAAVTDLAARSGLDKGTTSRLLATLRDQGFIRQRASDRRYLLSSRLLRIAQAYLAQLDIREVARPHLLRLRDLANETIHLAVREGLRVVYVDQLEPDRSVRHTFAVGQALPLHTTAMGRAILARLPMAEREELFGLLAQDRSHDHLIADLGRWRQEVADAERRGWATVDRDDDVTRVAAAIVDATAAPVGAVTISGPGYRMADHQRELGDQCAGTAAAISHDLGA